MKNKRFFLSLSLLIIFINSCGTLQVSIDQSSKPIETEQEPSTIATISALQTQNALLSGQYPPTDDTGNVPLNLQSDSETIRQKMLFSHLYWSQAWLDAEFTYFSTDGKTSAQADHVQIWVDQPKFRFRVLIAPKNHMVSRYLVANGQSVLNMNLTTGDSESYSLPPIPEIYPKPSTAISDTIEPHPISGQLSTPISEMLFPTALAQRGGYYIPIDIATTAGRPALVVDWYRFQPGERVDRFWIDIVTGVILQWQNFSKQGGEVLNSQAIFNQVIFDPSIPDDLFLIPPSILPTFAQNPSGTPLDIIEPTPVPTSINADPNGELYLTLMAASYSGPNLRLVHLPGTCVIGSSPCPSNGPEIVPDYPNTNFTILPLIWNAEGSQAIVPYPTQSSGFPYGLYSFEPDQASWRILTEMPVIEQPSWSKDRKWIIFQGEQDGIRDLFAIHPDGTDLKNLTQGKFAGDFSSFIMGGWLSINNYLYAFGNPEHASIYQINIENSQYSPLEMDFPAGKSSFLPSPNGKYIAVTDGPGVELFNINGEQIRQLATFQNTSITLHAWSSDSQWLLFNGNGPNSDDVFIARQDGRDIRQIYSGSTIGHPIFSPDDSYIIIEDSNSSGDRLYIYSLESGNYQLVIAPGLEFSDSWRAPSWRPNP